MTATGGGSDPRDGAAGRPGRSSRELARAYLTQIAALEGDAWILEGRTRAEAIALVRGAGRSGSRVSPGDAGGAATATGAEAARPADAGGTDPTGSAAPGPRGRTADEEIAAAPSLEALSEMVAGCTRCALHEARMNAVFGEGNPRARVVCVGEAPGANEDRTGRPFVGRAGQLLDRLLLSIGLPREAVYICNVLKSRPPRNRDPLPEEVEACSPYLLRQLSLIQPEVILAFGAFAARTLLGTSGALGRMRGDVHEYAGFPVVVTYHPAALLRNPGWTRPTWEDLQIVRRMLDGEAA